METIVKIKALEGVQLPEYATVGSAGVDLINHRFLKLYQGNREVPIEKLKISIEEKKAIMLRGFERVLVGTGLYMEIPEGYELQVRTRSGVSLKRGLIVLNAPGTIDSDYRGEVGIIICNTTPWLSEVKLGESIGQGVLAKHERAKFVLDNLSETQRGEGGYGSTNKPVLTQEEINQYNEFKYQ